MARGKLLNSRNTGTLPTVKTLQGLHWENVKNSKPLRWFWYSFVGMFFYEFFPAYIFPWLNAISIPCLASMHAEGSQAKVLTNLFGGSINNEGLGLFSISLDWQYITSFQTALPLKLQAHAAVGFFVCFLAMLGIYYTDAWGAKSQPFMSTKLRTEDGKAYPITDVFAGGLLDHEAFAEAGIPRLAGSFAYAMFIANAAVSLRPKNEDPSCGLTKIHLDRCPRCPLLPVLGQRRRQAVQEREGWQI